MQAILSLRGGQTLQEGISSAAKAVEHSIKHGQPLDFVDTRPVTDLLNEVGAGDLSAIDPSMTGKPHMPKDPLLY